MDGGGEGTCPSSVDLMRELSCMACGCCPTGLPTLGSAVGPMGAQCWCLCTGIARCTNPSAVVPSLIKCVEPQAIYGEEKSVFHL